MTTNDLIAAQATPAGRSALAVIRLSGDGAVSLTEDLMRLDDGRLRGMRRAVGPVYRGDTAVDSVVAVSWPEGKSYTGEEMVEIICHGIPAVTRDLLALLMSRGAREAEPGEFTRRAFLSGAMDGVDVLALSAMCEGGPAETAGTFRRMAESALRKLDSVREELEGRIEFGETHGEGMSGEVLSRELRSLAEDLEELGSMGRTMDLRSRVFLMGPPNTGKSTLFNLLAGGRHAVVSDSPGTTRDGRSVEIGIGGRSILLFDTAGAGGEGLDGEAGRISSALLGEEDRIVWLAGEDGGGPGSETAAAVADVVTVQPKSDLHGREGFRVSSVTGEGLPELRSWLVSSPGELSLSGLTSFLVSMADTAVRSFESEDETQAAEALTEASIRLQSLLGEGDTALCIERALSRLCVGK